MAQAKTWVASMCTPVVWSRRCWSEELQVQRLAAGSEVVTAFAAGLDGPVRATAEAGPTGFVGAYQAKVPAAALGLGRGRPTRRQRRHPLRDSCERIAKRRGKQIAKGAVARRRLTLCFYGLRDGEIRCLALRATVRALRSPAVTP